VKLTALKKPGCSASVAEWPIPRSVTQLFVAVVAQQRLITLHGRVVAANTGEAMANVRVVAKLTDKTTISDANGAFT
jgi:hypothetical protein